MGLESPQVEQAAVCAVSNVDAVSGELFSFFGVGLELPQVEQAAVCAVSNVDAVSPWDHGETNVPHKVPAHGHAATRRPAWPSKTQQ